MDGDEHKRDELAASEARYRELAEEMPILVCSTLPDGTITYMNELAAAAVGGAAADLIGQNIRGVSDAGTEDLVATARTALSAQHPVETHEESIRSADGSVRRHEWTSRGFFDDGGKLLRIQAIGRDVTERRRAEAALLKSELRLRLADQVTSDVVWDWDVVKDEQTWNAAGAAIFGWSEIAAGPQPATWWVDRVHDDDRRRVDERFFAALDDPAETSWHDEYRFRRADGSYAQVLDRATILRDGDGRATRMVGAMLDITERRTAEEALEHSRALLAASQEIAQVGSWQLEVTSGALTWSDEVYRIFGLDPGAFPATYDGFLDAVHPDDREMVDGAYTQSICDGADTYDIEHRIVRRDSGEIRYVHERCVHERDATGSVVRSTGMVQDITERKRAEEQILQTRQQYETFINSTDDMAFLKDDQLRYIIVNAANAAFFGRQAADIVGRTDHELMPVAAAEACRASDLQALETGGLVITTETQKGSAYESRKFPVVLADGRTGVGGYVRDVTEQWHAEAEILRLATDLERRVDQRTAQLEATNRELQSFAYSISHDLRAPLRALDGFSEILLQDYGEILDDAGRDHLRRIKGAANRMAGLMDGLLQLSRLNREELVFQEVDLSAMAESIVAELREREPARGVLVEIAPGLVASADPKLIRIVLENLLANAWKFTSRHEQARIEVGAERQDGGDVFFVRDDGAGFDMRYARNLFGAFQRLHTPDQFEGTGIGLATVQRIVHRHAGTVWAEGEVEKGATVWFTLGPAGA